MGDHKFDTFLNYLRRVPAISDGAIGTGIFDDWNWWVKFSLEITHPLAWHVIQEFGYVLNYMSLDERLPTVFMPVSPPPYLNGGPDDYLSWVIESKDASFTPDTAAKWLETRLPNPVDDPAQWEQD